MELQDLWTMALGIGEEAKDLNAGQAAMRALVIYVVTLAFIRLAKKRFLGSASAFDVVVGIIVGSIASRAITANAPLLPASAAIAAIVAVHWLFSGIAMRWHGFGELVKGGNRLLVSDGRVDEGELRAAHMSSRDLEEALREKGVTDVADVAEAHLERDGSVSVIQRKKEELKVAEVSVADGIQTVRIELKS
jgi:uncharacterized membrane protein YcaP (DUF421 family)